MTNCDKCGKRISIEESILHSLDDAGIAWYNCHECEEYLHGTEKESPRKHRREETFEEICEGIREYREKVAKNMNFAPRRR